MDPKWWIFQQALFDCLRATQARSAHAAPGAGPLTHLEKCACVADCAVESPVKRQSVSRYRQTNTIAADQNFSGRKIRYKFDLSAETKLFLVELYKP